MTKQSNCKSEETAILGAVINWNGWRDTVRCVESLMEQNGPSFQLVICDNGSSDDSVRQLSDWLASQAVSSAQFHTIPRPDIHATRFNGAFSTTLKTVYLLRLPKNMGYAGAINQCIDWGRQALMARHFWLLNNDVKADPQALAQLVEATRFAPDIGLCGSVLLDWDHPESVQAIGGVYRRYLAVGQHMQVLPAASDKHGRAFFDIDYPVGASLFVTQKYLDAVGLMDDAYFLYYEEMDWAERGRRLGFRPAVALGSLVQHKEGASTGSHGGVRNKSILSEHYGVINRLRITQKFWPQYLPVVWCSLWLVTLDRLIHGEWDRAGLVLKLMFSPWLWMLRRKHD